MTRILLPALAAGSLLLSGCAASGVLGVVTMPVKAVGKGFDLATTSQAEADRNYGKKMRKAEEREGRERKEHEKACRKDSRACGPYDGYRARDERDDS